MKTLNYAFATAALLLFSMFAQAEQKQRIGDWEVHYSAFNSTFITPKVAAQYDITRSEKRGLINISVLNANNNEAVKTALKGYVSNPRGGVQNLQFKQVNEGESVYYLANFLFGDEELMRFTINFPSANNPNSTLTFEQTFYQE